MRLKYEPFSEPIQISDELWLTCLRVMQRDGNLSFLNGRSRPSPQRSFL